MGTWKRCGWVFKSLERNVFDPKQRLHSRNAPVVSSVGGGGVGWRGGSGARERTLEG